MTNTGGATIPAGWYTDPAGSGHLRWWDGAAWTAHLAPQPAPTPTPTPVAVQPVPHQPVVQQPVVQQPVVQQPMFQPPTLQPPTFQSVDTRSAAVLTADNQPYVPFQGSWNGTAQGGGYPSVGSDEFARPAEWNTAWAWFLAAWPIYFVGLSVLAGFFSAQLRLSGSVGGVELVDGALGIVEIILVVFVISAAFRDRSTLRRWGYLNPASPWWILFGVLVGPLVYLIVRTIRVYREVRRGIAPLILFIASGIATSIIYALVAVAVVGSLLAGTGALGTTSSLEFASSLQTGLNEKGGHFTVTCPPTIPTTIGATFSCSAVDSAGVSHKLGIQVITGADGKPGVKLLSVVPAIAG